jgi:hypothetical protein
MEEICLKIEEREGMVQQKKDELRK